MDGEGARKLGERLVGEVEVEGLAEFLSSLRDISITGDQPRYFNIPKLDALLPKPTPPPPPTVPVNNPHEQDPVRNDLWDPDSTFNAAGPITEPRPNPRPPPTAPSKPPILELISPPATNHPSGSGKTSLIHLITTLAILPANLSSIPLSGHEASIIIFDPLSHFSTARLTQVILSHISQGLAPHPAHPEIPASTITSTVHRALQHVHIFRPQSWASLLETLRGLDSYLFDSSRHRSTNRRIHTLVLEDIDAFYWTLRTPTHDPSASTSTSTNANPLTSASTALTSTLLHLRAQLSCTIVLTSRSASPASSPAFRAPVPLFWPRDVQVTRVGVQRVEVLKFVAELGVEEAEAEREKRWEVVRRGRVECWKVGEGRGFVVRVGMGVEVEE